MDTAFFRSFFGGNAKITPAGMRLLFSYPFRLSVLNWTHGEYNDETPVVVAELSNAQAGAVFGVSKIKVSYTMPV